MMQLKITPNFTTAQYLRQKQSLAISISLRIVLYIHVMQKQVGLFAFVYQQHMPLMTY